MALENIASPLREALLRYDPQAKVISSVTKINDGVYRIEYVDTARVRYSFTFREHDA